MNMPLGHQRKKIMIVSHERSGTHFLMNAIARCFDYVSSPWVNLDGCTIPTNFHCPEDMKRLFAQYSGIFPVNVFKSHHPYVFYVDNIHTFIEEFHIFYIYRDPRDVMVSMWRYLNRLPWHEGPKTESPKELIRAQPSGNMLRYQWDQEPTMIHRWRTHVDSWTNGMPDIARSRLTLIRFKDLATNYEQTIQSIGEVLGEPKGFERPGLNDSSILPNQGAVGAYKNVFDSDDLKLFRAIAGPTMDRLGYE
jgi:hypothetical protein